jgi:O-antigen/teichoic acid export membrane protein
MWALLSTWVRQALSLAILLILARLLAPEDFGLVAMCRVYTVFITMVAVQGLSDAIMQRAELEDDHIDAAFWFSLILALAIVALTFVFGSHISDLFDEPRLTTPLRVLSVTVLLAALQGIPEAMLRRTLAFRVLAIRSLVATCIGGGVGVGLATSGYGHWSLVGHYVGFSLSSAALLWVACDWRPSMRLSLSHLKELMGFSGHLTAARVVSAVTTRSPDVVIGVVLGAEALGFYTVGSRLLRQMIKALSTINRQVALPVFSRTQDQVGRLRRAFLDATRLTGLAAFPTFAAGAVLAPDVVPIWFGEQWQPCILLVQIMAARGFVRSLQPINTTLLTAVGRTDLHLRLRLGFAALALPALAASVSSGIYWVAAAMFPPAVIIMVATVWTICRHTRVTATDYVRQLFGPALATLVMAGAMLLLRTPLIGHVDVYWVLIGQLLAGAGLYVVLIFIFDRELARQLQELVRMAWSGKPTRRGGTTPGNPDSEL